MLLFFDQLLPAVLLLPSIRDVPASETQQRDADHLRQGYE